MLACAAAVEDRRFTVPLSDLEYGPKDVDWPVPADWLGEALADTEATPRGEPGRVKATLTKNGRQVVVRGKVTAALSMPCARTLEPTDVDVEGEIFLMLSPVSPSPTAPKTQRARGRRAVKRDQTEEAELQDEDAARDTYEGDVIVLDAFVREFIVLELPMFPLHSEDVAAIPHAPETREPSEGGLDPRLAPLAELKRKLDGSSGD